MARFTQDGQIASLVTNVGPFPWEILPLVQQAQIDLSTQQTSQLTLTILDPDMKLIGEGFFMQGWAVALGGLFFQVRTRQMLMVGNQIGLQVTALSQGICQMMGLTGALVRSNLSYTDYIALDAKACGLNFFGQPSPVQSQIVRTDDGITKQTAWDVAQAGAQQLGYWLFESAGTVYFGQPSWLATNLPRYWVRWKGENTTDPIVNPPLMQYSLDNLQEGNNGTFDAEPDSADTFIPGIGVQLEGVGQGIGSFDGVYLVTGLSLVLDGKTPGTVTLAQPLNPVPGNASGGVQAPPKSGAYSTQYPFVSPGPLSSKGWTWPAAGNIKGSVAAGISIYGAVGAAVEAVAAGTVVRTSSTSGAAVRIDHGNNIFSEVTHLGSITVSVGQQVSRGQRVGTMAPSSGNTGYVHVQVFIGTVQVAPTDYFPPIP